MSQFSTILCNANSDTFNLNAIVPRHGTHFLGRSNKLDCFVWSEIAQILPRYSGPPTVERR